MFEITIKEIKTENQLTGKKWEVVGEEDSGIKDKNGTPVPTRKYGYTPDIETPVEVEKKIFKQTVQTLDILAVIIAINRK